MTGRVTSAVDAVETLSGGDLFSNLPPPIRQCIEAGSQTQSSQRCANGARGRPQDVDLVSGHAAAATSTLAVSDLVESSRMSLDRRHEITRLEAFSDAVFAFALTLLVVSLEVPHSYHDLMNLVRGFVPFAACFALLVWIWYEHSAFFTKYPLRDRTAVVINAALLFVVLFYVYPLKYVFTQMFGFLQPDPRPGDALTPSQLATIFAIYGAGYAAVFLLFAALYFHAWRRRAALGLTPFEAFEARLEMGEQLVSAGVGLAAACWALAAPRSYFLVSLSGFMYMLMAPAHTMYGAWHGRQRRAFEARATRA